ncbi:MAG: DmsC/YnfH family molybdoenzyme membrane anchor subunit [Terrimicrobiaceae bacterium]
MSVTGIDLLLAEQADLTAVGRFSRAHDAALPNAREPSYRALIPFEKPGKGEQYAFEVNLDQCTGCKACVAACHSLNGLEEEETWREVGLLLGGTAKSPRQQTVTSACHHCEDPGCLEGCPVLAYEKDGETGIVRHLDDQCIGCQYCILKCPYEVPKYSEKLGIVRKCDMCHSRLAADEAPACVQACPTSAISIRIISSPEIRRNAESGFFLPDSPDSRLTKPSTTYTSARPLSERALAADHHRPNVQHAHWPLVFMLVLTQAGVGLLTGGLFPGARPFAVVAGTLLIQFGLAVSVMHLGQPLKAWRAFLGWRTSWLSREIIVLGALGPLSAAAAAAGFFEPTRPWQPLLVLVSATTGWLGVLCSAWVYHDTGRMVWRGPLSFGRFFLTGAIFAALAAEEIPAFFALAGFKLVIGMALVVRGATKSLRLDDLDRSARLLRGPLRPWVAIRFVAGGAALLLVADGHQAGGGLIFLVSELLERALFFLAGIGKKMPGQPP